MKPLPLDALASYPGVLAWYMLGSGAQGTLRPDSDLDLAVKQCLTSGRRVVCLDEPATNRRVSELMALYLKFQEDRKEVLDAYRA